MKEQYLNIINKIDLYHNRYDELTDDKRFIEDLAFDSLDIIELIMELERHFNIRIDDYRAFECVTIGKGFELLKKTIVNDTNTKS